MNSRRETFRLEDYFVGTLQDVAEALSLSMTSIIDDPAVEACLPRHEQRRFKKDDFETAETFLFRIEFARLTQLMEALVGWCRAHGYAHLLQGERVVTDDTVWRL